MEATLDEVREAKIDALLIDLSLTDDSAEAAAKARELKQLIAKTGMPGVTEAHLTALLPSRSDLRGEFASARKYSRAFFWVAAVGLLWSIWLLNAGYFIGAEAQHMSPRTFIIVWSITIALLASMIFAAVMEIKKFNGFAKRLAQLESTAATLPDQGKADGVSPR